MKTTTAIRRFDDLGRIVIPKEIRKAVGVAEGTPMEVFYDEQKGTIVLQKYSIYNGVLTNLEYATEDLRMLAGEPYLQDEERHLVNQAVEALCVMCKELRPILRN